MKKVVTVIKENFVLENGWIVENQQIKLSWRRRQESTVGDCEKIVQIWEMIVATLLLVMIGQMEKSFGVFNS